MCCHSSSSLEESQHQAHSLRTRRSSHWIIRSAGFPRRPPEAPPVADELQRHLFYRDPPRKTRGPLVLRHLLRCEPSPPIAGTQPPAIHNCRYKAARGGVPDPSSDRDPHFSTLGSNSPYHAGYPHQRAPPMTFFFLDHRRNLTTTLGANGGRPEAISGHLEMGKEPRASAPSTNSCCRTKKEIRFPMSTR